MITHISSHLQYVAIVFIITSYCRGAIISEYLHVYFCKAFLCARCVRMLLFVKVVLMKSLEGRDDGQDGEPILNIVSEMEIEINHVLLL